jgi:deoxyhypusine synthase
MSAVPAGNWFRSRCVLRSRGAWTYAPVASPGRLQPEPALSQVLGQIEITGYDFDVQIVSPPVSDGSLSSCEPCEAVTWGKVKKETYPIATASMQADYTTVMPFLVKALLDNRRRYSNMVQEIGAEATCS